MSLEIWFIYENMFIQMVQKVLKIEDSSKPFHLFSPSMFSTVFGIWILIFLKLVILINWNESVH